MKTKHTLALKKSLKYLTHRYGGTWRGHSAKDYEKSSQYFVVSHILDTSKLDKNKQYKRVGEFWEEL